MWGVSASVNDHDRIYAMVALSHPVVHVAVRTLFFFRVSPYLFFVIDSPHTLNLFVGSFLSTGQPLT